MAIPNVTTDTPVLASTTNALIDRANAIIGRWVSPGPGTYNWQVPKGVSRFRVTLCGGGGAAAINEFESSYTGGPGGNGPMVSKHFVDQEEGTTYQVVVGIAGLPNNSNPAGRTGGNTVFGADLLWSAGGGPGSEFGGMGGMGAHGGGEVLHGNWIYMVDQFHGYGMGGHTGMMTFGSINNNYFGMPGMTPNGMPGICVIEW